MRRKFPIPDLPVIFAWIGLVVLGLVAIYSTTNGPISEFLFESQRQSFARQATFGGVCFIGLGIALALPVRFFQNAAYVIYGITTLLLVAALVVGRDVNGAKSWIYIGPIGLQVSELAKVGTLLAVAQLLSARRAYGNLQYALGAVGLIVVPAILIVLQNDTGTALVFFALVPIMLFWSGLPLVPVMVLISPAIAGYFAIVHMPTAIIFSVVFTLGILAFTRERLATAAAAAFTGGTTAVISVALAKVLQPYQLARVLSFTNPEAEEYRRSAGFHLVQSKAAIGSGGFWGKGFMEGTQTQGAYVPEQSTDFIYSVIGEELGFIGGIAVLLLFAFLLVRLLMLSTQIKHPFGRLVIVGSVGIYLVHILINAGMVMALLPVIGIPLPFISYGGSALLANSAMLAIGLSLHMRRDDFSIYGY